MSDADLDEIADLIASRFKALVPRLTERLPRALRWVLRRAGTFVALLGKKKLRDYLASQLEK
jgi:hypothetical protein